MLNNNTRFFLQYSLKFLPTIYTLVPLSSPMGSDILLSAPPPPAQDHHTCQVFEDNTTSNDLIGCSWSGVHKLRRLWSAVSQCSTFFFVGFVWLDFVLWGHFLCSVILSFHRLVLMCEGNSNGRVRSEAEEKVYNWLYAIAQSDREMVFEYVNSTERGRMVG